jgi:transposase-like protein
MPGPAGSCCQKGRRGWCRKLVGAPGRGTAAKDTPSILGLIQRGGQVVLHMLANVQQTTIKPIISAAVTPGTLVHTDEYAIYARLPAWG